MRFLRRALLLATVAVAALSFCNSAGAEIFQIGPSLSGGGWTPKVCESSGCAFFNNYGKAPAPGVPPVWYSPLGPGVIVRLNVVGATTPGQFRVRTLDATGLFEGVFLKASAPVDVVPSAGVQTYQMSMPISGGEEVALSMSEGSSIGLLEEVGNFYRWDSDPVESGSARYDGKNSGLVGFNVEVQPPPSINMIGITTGLTLGPVLGGSGGGTTVFISGQNLEGASAVSFGSVPAASFTVDSESRITAVSPPSSIFGPVDISVTTIAGKATSSHSFVYEYSPPPLQCVVPKLHGRTVEAVRRMLGRAKCELGMVHKLDGATAKSGRVLRQSAKPGTILGFLEEISVTLKPAKPIGRKHGKK